MGSKARENAKPQVLRLYCSIFSTQVSDEERNARDGVKTVAGSKPFITLKHIELEATLYLIRSGIGSQYGFPGGM